MKIPKLPGNARVFSLGLGCIAIAALAMAPLQHDASRAGKNELDKDAMALLAERSPGARPEGALISSKPLARAAAKPRQYAMPKVRERVPPGGVAAPAHPLGNPVALFPQNANAVPLDRITSVSGPGGYYPFPGHGDSPGGVAIPPATSANVPPGVGGPIIPPDVGEPGVPPGTGGPNPPGPPVAVPEPAIWMNLILGFGAIGWMIRARRAKLLPARP